MNMKLAGIIKIEKTIAIQNEYAIPPHQYSLRCALPSPFQLLMVRTTKNLLNHQKKMFAEQKKPTNRESL